VTLWILHRWNGLSTFNFKNERKNMNISINAPTKKGNCKLLYVWFEGNGSSAVSVLEGQGVCYNWDYGTAASVDARRTNRVELPTILNARFFAGVLARNYSIPKDGRFVEVNAPGSTCNILSKASSTIGVGILTCLAGGTYAGYFQYAGFEGEGSVVPLQTIDRSSTAGLCLAKLQEGKPSGLSEALTSTVGGAVTCMVGGVTVFPALTRSVGLATFTMADGTIAGMRKKFVTIGEQTTYGVDISVAGVQLNGTSAAAGVVLTEALDEVTFEWNGDWYMVGQVAATVD
jgi:hypothetical protein